MLNDSNEVRKLCKLSSLTVFNCEWENCRCRMCTPLANKSGDNAVTDRSKSYMDNDWTGTFISCNVERNEPDVVLGQSRKRPRKYFEIGNYKNAIIERGII